jgi:tRNA dimethylallyltransferase
VTDRSLVAIVGPTAVGKTAVAVELCRRNGGEIVSFDSRQIYRGLEICSNAPTGRDLRGVRCHLTGEIPIGSKVDAALYVGMARPIVEDLVAAGRPAVLTSGTGLYLKALLEGLDLGGHASDPGLRRRLDAQARVNLGALHQRLVRLDPGAAAKVDNSNPARVVRAVELALRRQRGDRATSKAVPALAATKIGLQAPRSRLYEWIDARLDMMLAAGWMAEIEALVRSGVAISGTALSGIGVRELADVVAGRLELEVARAVIAKRTRNYAKRQLTWFRADPQVRWLDVTQFTGSDIVEAILDLSEKR